MIKFQDGLKSEIFSENIFRVEHVSAKRPELPTDSFPIEFAAREDLQLAKGSPPKECLQKSFIKMMFTFSFKN